MMKINNKVLFIALVVLVAAFVLARQFRAPALESNVRRELARLDTTLVTEVKIHPAVESGEIRLVRSGARWKVVKENREEEAEGGSVEGMLGVLMKLDAQRMMSRKKEKWDTYAVGDSATRVMVFAGSAKKADLRIGKTGFSQGTGAGGAFTYVRLNDEEEVYSTEGMLDGHFNKTFNAWRNKLFLKVKKEEVARINFNYPDSGFVMEKRDSLWYVNDQPVNDSKLSIYLSKIRFKTVSDFEDGFVPPGEAVLSIQVVPKQGAAMEVKAWPKEAGEWVLHSTLQENVYFKGKADGAVKDIFVGINSFLQ